jgi:hypothetical protein
MSDFGLSNFFDLSAFDLRDNGEPVTNERISAKEKDARRKDAPNVNGGQPTAGSDADAPDFTLPQGLRYLGEEQLEAEMEALKAAKAAEQEACRNAASTAEPLPPGFKRLTPEETPAWAKSYEPGNGYALPYSKFYDPNNPGPDCTVYTADEVESWRKKKKNGDTPPAEDRPTIIAMPGDLPQVVDAAESALIQADAGLYRRGTTLVRPTVATLRISRGRQTAAQCLTLVSPHTLAEEFTRAAVWMRPKRGRLVTTDAPLSVAKTYLARTGRWRLPALTGIVNCPTMRDDGSLLDQPGYDERTGLLFDPQGCEFLPVADKPTREDAR